MGKIQEYKNDKYLGHRLPDYRKVLASLLFLVSLLLLASLQLLATCLSSSLFFFTSLLRLVVLLAFILLLAALLLLASPAVAGKIAGIAGVQHLCSFRDVPAAALPTQNLLLAFLVLLACLLMVTFLVLLASLL
jgi:hypothetical protein